MLSIETVHEHLRRHYAIDGDVERVRKGRATNYAVSSGGSRWLFKVFQPEHAPGRFSHASAFVSYLARSGYPVREFAQSETDARVTVLDGRAAVLIPWIEGEAPVPNTVSSSEALEQIGSLCGRLHRLGSEYPGGETLEAAGRVLSRKAVEEQRASDKRATLVALATQTHDAEIKDEVSVRLAILNTLGDALALSRQQAPRGIIHGDFFCAHVVFRGNRAVGVIDLLGERYMPGWELMRSFFQSVPSAFDSPTFDDALWRAYAAGYASEHRLDGRAVAAAYDEYLLQLTGSTYGLQAPLDDALRQFGRWRTRLAAYLAKNRDELRARMAAAMTM